MANDRQAVSSQSGGDVLEQYMLTAGGKIQCLRCTARSNRSGLQCKKPALKVSRTQKCGHHGGRPHSPETIQRIANANTVHGQSTKVALQQHQAEKVLLRELEDVLHVMGWAQGPRTQGRKPKGYVGVYSESDVIRMIRERVLHRM
jgi:hypothetical protein